jgi:hypothetical protein
VSVRMVVWGLDKKDKVMELVKLKFMPRLRGRFLYLDKVRAWLDSIYA